MELDFLQHLLGSGLGFKVLVLLGVAGAYVSFEFIMSLRARGVRAAVLPASKPQSAALEAYGSLSN